MKHLIIFLMIATQVGSSNFQCGKQKEKNECFKGKLEIKGICMNYTIKLVEGNMDPNFIQSSWTDEHTGKTYTNVFALGSPCNFPAEIKEGDEFSFVIDSNPDNSCAVCRAYYPTPEKKLAIKVLKNPCQ